MTKKDKTVLSHIIDADGFDYTFTEYSDFKGIEDVKFHKLREAYKKAAASLKEYCFDESLLE